MGGSVLLATTPAATEAKYLSEVYLATGSREDGAKLQFVRTNSYHGVSSLSHVKERRAQQMADLIVIDQLMMNSECLWGVIFIWLFPLTIFPH